MDLKSEFTRRTLIVYIVAIVAPVILTPLIWGLAGGVIGGFAWSRNPQHIQVLESFLKARGMAPTDEHGFRKLSEVDKQAFTDLSVQFLSDIYWFLLILSVSVLMFALVGFLGGLLARTWALAGIVPALSFFITNPLMSPKADSFSTLEKAIIVCVQFGSCLGLAFCGARLASKRHEKKLI